MTCACNFEKTGRCWLWVDEWWFEKNFKRLQCGDALAVYTFAVEEVNRLKEKADQMERLKLYEIFPDYCGQGTCFETESERNQRILEFTKQLDERGNGNG